MPLRARQLHLFFDLPPAIVIGVMELKGRAQNHCICEQLIRTRGGFNWGRGAWVKAMMGGG